MTGSGFSDDEELILEIATPKGELSDTITGYNHAGATYLPLGAIARFLDLAVTVSDAGRYAAGWVLDPARTLSVNLRDGTVMIAGKTVALQPGDAIAFDDEMFVRAERFADLLPLALVPNLRNQSIVVQTREPFPFEQRLERAAARDRLNSRQSARTGPPLVRRDSPWQALSPPLVDAELALATDSQRGARVESDLRLAGDLAWLTAKSYVGGNSRDGLTAARLELGRQDPDGGLLGPLHATAFALGDISSTPMPLGLAGAAGRGIQLGNAPLEQASIFDQIDLRGEMPDGFEAELYRNDVLIDTARAPVDGQYRFLNVPVEFGLNLFKVVLFGPQGQRRETLRQISVGDGRLARGELRYAAGLVQKSRNLFNLTDRATDSLFADQGWRGTAQMQYGLSSAVTLQGGAALYQRRGRSEWTVTTGLRTGLGGTALRLDLGLGRGGTGAMALGLARSFGSFTLTASHAEYRGGFVDEVRSLSDLPLARASELTVNGMIRLGGGAGALRVPVNGFVRDITFADGQRNLTAAASQTVSLSRALQLSNLIEFNRTRSPLMGSQSQLRGTFDLTTLARARWQIRSGLGYRLSGGADITSAAVQVDRQVGDSGGVSLSYARAFDAAQDRFALSAINRFRHFSLALDSSYATRPSQFAVMLRAGVSLGRNPLDGRLFAAPPGLASGGVMALRAFRDLDGNGRFDPAEPVVSDARFFTGTDSAVTDANGVALLSRLGDGRRTGVRVDADTLPDIALAPVAPGVEFVSRAGHVQVETFAFRALGSLDGVARLRGADGLRPVSGITLVLEDAAGKEVERTRSGSDGSFWFEQIAPGPYRLALDPVQAGRMGLRMASDPTLTFGGDGKALRITVELAPSN